jgi:phosphonoacetaldehyde hydrolase
MKVRLVVFDWAGTTVDHGCFAPVTPFVEAFTRHGVTVMPAQARVPMGLEKKDHLRELFLLPDVAAQWNKVHGRPWTEADVEALFENDFRPRQLEVVPRHSKLIPGLLDCVAELRKRGIKIGTTTGYFRAAADVVLAAARVQGYHPDSNVIPEDVSAGRPLPWMIFRNMEALGVYPPSAVLKVGDTVPDIHEGLNAAAWSVGVVRTGSEVGLSEDDLARTPPQRLGELLQAARDKLLQAGAHAVIDTLAELPGLIDAIQNDKLTASRISQSRSTA